MLQTGDADIIGSVDADLYDVAKADPNLVVTVDQTLDENYLAMTSACNTELSPESAALLCDVRIRQAVAYAIDYDGLINAVLDGYGVRAPSIIPLGVLGVDPAKVWGRDVENPRHCWRMPVMLMALPWITTMPPTRPVKLSPQKSRTIWQKLASPST